MVRVISERSKKPVIVKVAPNVAGKSCHILLVELLLGTQDQNSTTSKNPMLKKMRISKKLMRPSILLLLATKKLSYFLNIALA